MIAYEERIRAGGTEALEEAERFFMKEDAVHQTLRSIVARLESLGIDYAVVGGMALVAHGYKRTTVDVDLLVTAEGNRAIHQHLDGLGYVPPFPGSKNLRDTETGVRIEFLITGQFPGDGKPKPVSFPVPSTISEEIKGARYARLETIIELKLASGITNPGRVKDLGDVQELIRVLRLPRNLAESLNEFVRSKYVELWDAVEWEPREP